MSFRNFFIDYKIGLKNISNSIKTKDLPLYRKIAVVVAFITLITIIMSAVLLRKQGTIQYEVLVTIIVFLFFLIIIFNFVNDTKTNMIKMNKIYIKKNGQRMLVLSEVLKKYDVDVADVKQLKDLKEQAEYEKKNNDPFQGLEKPIKILYITTVPMIVYVAKKMALEIEQKSDIYAVTMIATVIIIICACLVSSIFALKPLFYFLFYSDYEKYENLIYDLNQMILFKKNREIGDE